MSTSLQATLEQWVTARWYGKSPGWLWCLLPFEALFRCIAWVRRRLYTTGSLATDQLPVPTIVVGNIVAGGAGKTPVISALARLLSACGYQPGIVSRGYGRESDELVFVTAESLPEEVGDEPLLLFRETGVPVAVARQRALAARSLIEAGCDVVLSDDGLQHYALARDIEVAVIPGSRREGNGHLIPVGPLREPRTRLQHCTFRLVINGEGGEDEYSVCGQPGELRGLQDGQLKPLAELAGREVLAIAAIAHPEPFFNTLSESGLKVEARRFGDHHRFTEADFADSQHRPLVMTTKDAVKYKLPAGREAYALEYTVNFPQTFADALIALVAKVAAQKQGMNNPNAG